MTVYVKFGVPAKTLAGTQGGFGCGRNMFVSYAGNTNVYHPMNTWTDQSIEYNKRVKAFGTYGPSLMEYNLFTDVLKTLLPTWIADGTTRKNTIRANAETNGFFGVLDGIVNLMGMNVYFRFVTPPRCITGITVEQLADEGEYIWHGQYAHLVDLEAGNWTIAGKYQSFVSDVVALCYERYGAGKCDQWIWSNGNECLVENYAHAGLASAESMTKCILKADYAVLGAIKGYNSNCRTAGLENFDGHILDILQWYDANKANEIDYLQYTDFISFHMYPTPTWAENVKMDWSVQISAGGSVDDMNTIRALLSSLTTYRGRSNVPGIIFGETAYGNADTEHPDISLTYKNGVWKTLQIAAALYNGVRDCVQWSDWDDGNYGFIQGWDVYSTYWIDIFDTTLLPLYWGQAKLKSWCRLEGGDQFVVVNKDNGNSVGSPCNDVADSVSVYGVKVAGVKDRVVCIWNRRTGTVSPVINVVLDGAWDESGNVKVEQFVQSVDYPNGNVSVLADSKAYTGRNVVYTVATSPISFTMLRFSVPGGSDPVPPPPEHKWAGTWGY